MRRRAHRAGPTASRVSPDVSRERSRASIARTSAIARSLGRAVFPVFFRQFTTLLADPARDRLAARVSAVGIRVRRSRSARAIRGCSPGPEALPRPGLARRRDGRGGTIRRSACLYTGVAVLPRSARASNVAREYQHVSPSVSRLVGGETSSPLTFSCAWASTTARASFLEIVERTVLDRHPVLQESIRLRNPYVDPMNAIQVELLRRHRAGDEASLRPVLRSIAGIAAALRNTG